jgi:hypothetical protein
MTNEPNALRPKRWETFNEMELSTISGALGSVLDALTDPENIAEMTPEQADGAAATILIAGRLLYSISDHHGGQRPSLATLENVATAVAKRTVLSA